MPVPPVAAVLSLLSSLATRVVAGRPIAPQTHTLLSPPPSAVLLFSPCPRVFRCIPFMLSVCLCLLRHMPSHSMMHRNSLCGEGAFF